VKGYFRKMSFRDYLELTDPKVIRALAHPARMAILRLLDDGPVTATECAQVVDQSPSACSYHLRQLAAFGFIEPVESDDGRERRWRAAVGGYGVPKDVQDRPEILAALRPLARRWFADNQRVVEEFLATEPEFEPKWRQAATFHQTNPYVTPEELIRIDQQVQALLKPYYQRERPKGAERIYATFVAVPWPVKGPPKRAKAGARKTERERSRGGS
jgi:DNA-binding transcriptional ArsR family regulator